jgi:hypothetical protein
MKRTRTTEIIVETEEVFVLRSSIAAEKPVRCWCARCEMEFETIAPELFASFASVGARIVYRLVETGHLHFAETNEGALLICPNSLNAQVSDARPRLKGEIDDNEPHFQIK